MQKLSINVVLSECRTNGVSDYRGVGLMGCRTIGVTPYAIASKNEYWLTPLYKALKTKLYFDLVRKKNLV
jgi:hypothetical protein